MPRPRKTFGPGLTETIERGDIFRGSSTGRLWVVQGKVYQDDLSISYVCGTIGTSRTLMLDERNLLTRSDYVRVYISKRKVLTDGAS